MAMIEAVDDPGKQPQSQSAYPPTEKLRSSVESQFNLFIDKSVRSFSRAPSRLFSRHFH